MTSMSAVEDVNKETSSAVEDVNLLSDVNKETSSAVVDVNKETSSAVVDVNKETSPTQFIAQNNVNLYSNSFSYTWTLNNFSEFLKFPSAKLRSPSFSFEGSNWNLVIHSECENEKPHLVKVRLLKSNNKGPNYYIQHKFTLVDTKGSTLMRERSSTIAGGTIASHRLSFEVYEINRELDSVIEDDRLTIICELLVLSSKADAPPKEEKVAESKEQELENVVPKSFPSKSKELKVLIVDPTRERFISNRIEVIMLIPLVFFLLLALGKPKALPLNNNEINELIVDSTFKIRNIAEALNLTDVKIKSSELIGMFEERFNIYEDFPSVRDYLPEPPKNEFVNVKAMLSDLENITHTNSVDSQG